VSDLGERAIEEVHARHRAFVDWYTGAGDESLMDDTARALSPTMVQITPSGSIVERETLVKRLRAARGSQDGSFVIFVDGTRVLWRAGDAVLVAYVERQVIAAMRTARRSTALFTRDDGAPHGVVWQHVHETWIDTQHDREQGEHG